MAWCPKCKNEYKEGITVCADCGCELIASLLEEEKPIYFGPEEEILKMIDFLKANELNDAYCQYDENEDVYELIVKNQDRDQAKKLLKVFLREIAKKEMAEEETDTASKQENNQIYEETGKKAEDYRTGAMTLLLIGILGVIAIVLLVFDIIPVGLPDFTKKLTSGVMGALFILFIILGISSMSTYKKLKKTADTDEQKKADILLYVSNHITAEKIDAAIDTEGLSVEELYFARTKQLKEMLLEYSKDSSESFLDYVIEEIYGKLFE